MKVLTFSTLYPNAEQPGHGIFVENRILQLRKRYALSLEVVAPVPWFPLKSARFGRYSGYARVPPRETRNGLLVHHPRYPVIPKVGMNLAPRLLARWSIATIRALQSAGHDFDLIDAHYFYPDGVAAAMIAHALNKPLLITARGSDVNLIATYARPRAAILHAAAQAAAVITVSEALRRALLELGVDARKVHTLRNGVDLDFFTPPVNREKLRDELGWNRRTLLCVGNLVELKGHHLVIEALRDLPDTDLVIAGAGEERAALESLAQRLHLGVRVRFLGRVSQQELVHLYGAADALVLASSREGWANVLLESMACGTPVIATAVSGNPEVVAHRNAGLLTDDRSAASVARAVRALFATRIPRSATRAYAQDFSWDETSDRLWRLFKTAAGYTDAAAHDAQRDVKESVCGT